MHTITTYHPCYGPHGEPYRVVIDTAEGVVGEWYWTLSDALEARSVALDMGYAGVRVIGMPTIVGG